MRSSDMTVCNEKKTSKLLRLTVKKYNELFGNSCVKCRAIKRGVYKVRVVIIPKKKIKINSYNKRYQSLNPR